MTWVRHSVLRATAVHEAGHVVAAQNGRLKIRTVSIVASGDAAGQVEHESPLRGIRLDVDGSDRARLKAERAIIICLAGPIAQRRYAPRSWRNHHGCADHEMATDLASRVTGSARSAEAYLRWLEQVTADLIEGQWRRVVFVADYLLKNQRLSAHGIIELEEAWLRHVHSGALLVQEDGEGVVHLRRQG